MPIEKWSDTTVVVHVGDDPQFSEDMAGAQKTGSPLCHVVLDFAAVHFVNSSNIAQLLKLRRNLITNNAKVILCNLSSSVWGVFMVTGLDQVFEFSENVPTALATLQMKEQKKADRQRGAH